MCDRAKRDFSLARGAVPVKNETDTLFLLLTHTMHWWCWFCLILAFLRSNPMGLVADMVCFSNVDQHPIFTMTSWKEETHLPSLYESILLPPIQVPFNNMQHCHKNRQRLRVPYRY